MWGTLECWQENLAGKTENFAGREGRNLRGKLKDLGELCGENWVARTRRVAGKTGGFGGNSAGKSWRKRFAEVLFGGHVGDIITCVNSPIYSHFYTTFPL